VQELEPALECRAVAPAAQLGRNERKHEVRKLIVELSGLGLRKACGAQARVVDDPGLDVLLEHTYGWQKRLVDRLNRKSRGTTAFVAIEIADA